MTRQIIAGKVTYKMNTSPALRTQNLVQFYRAVALFSSPIRSVELGLRRRK